MSIRHHWSCRQHMDLPMTPRERLRRLELPHCRCVPVFIPRCQFDGWYRERKPGCEDRQQNGDCDCPWLPGEPCQHITHGNYLRQFIYYADRPGRERPGQLTDAEWAELLWAVFPSRYDDPPPAPIGVNSMVREDRVELLAMRRELGVRLFHPRDRVEIDDNPYVAKTAERFQNGQDSRDEVLVFAHEHEYEWEEAA